MGNAVIWASLAVAVVVAGAALARFAILALRGWRDLKRSRRALFAELDRVAEAADAVGVRAQALGTGSDRLTRSLARLRESRRRLAVLHSAVDEAKDAVAVVTWVIPRK